MQALWDLLRVEHLRDPLSWFDILLLWFVFYNLLQMIRRTRAVQMVYGLLALVLIWFVTDPSGLLPLKAVHWVLGQVLVYGGFAIIVIFQTPIRQALAHFGQLGLRRWHQPDPSELVIEEVALAAAAMGSRRIGALIVFERVQGLRNYIETGIQLDARVTYDLLINIFAPRTPLHDGAVIIGGGRIAAASCFLPLSVDPLISRQFGTRHRAAIGITEETDAVAVVVSEENGVVSIAAGGRIQKDLDTRALRAALADMLAAERPGTAARWRRADAARAARQTAETTR
ncbi:MAG: diadenylate cyclase CdaA [Acidobacteria bacterium]|nr:diadenylate cyclase CdaA [Acidobacteriota bacterium]